MQNVSRDRKVYDSIMIRLRFCTSSLRE